MSSITIIKLDHHGVEKIRYEGRVLARDDCTVTLEAFFTRPTMALGYVTLKTGDRFVEHFYSDCWYNVFAIYDGDDGAFKGWYCNVTRPAIITDGEVRAEDLALDVFVSPEGKIAVLDEDEFEELGLSSEEEAKAREAVEELLSWAREMNGPFATNPNINLQVHSAE